MSREELTLPTTGWGHSPKAIVGPFPLAGLIQGGEGGTHRASTQLCPCMCLAVSSGLLVRPQGASWQHLEPGLGSEIEQTSWAGERAVPWGSNRGAAETEIKTNRHITRATELCGLRGMCAHTLGQAPVLTPAGGHSGSLLQDAHLARPAVASCGQLGSLELLYLVTKSSLQDSSENAPKPRCRGLILTTPLAACLRERQHPRIKADTTQLLGLGRSVTHGLHPWAQDLRLLPRL